MKFILGTKQNMSQYFDADGKVHPATIIHVAPVIVTAIKTAEKDGYSAVQIGYGTQKEKRVSKAVRGSTKEHGIFAKLKEFRVPKAIAEAMKPGDTIESTVFAEGDKVSVSGVSKGKGFQGVVKRHGFHGGPRSHGQKHSEREPGSIGGGLRNRVPKGMRMAGRMGTDRITVRNLKVLSVDTANNVILLKGAIPGRKGTLIEITG